MAACCRPRPCGTPTLPIRFRCRRPLGSSRTPSQRKPNCAFGFYKCRLPVFGVGPAPPASAWQCDEHSKRQAGGCRCLPVILLPTRTSSSSSSPTVGGPGGHTELRLSFGLVCSR
jgi:hypothetical protein